MVRRQQVSLYPESVRYIEGLTGRSITIYAVEYFALVGVTGQEEGLFATVIFGIVKLCSSLICAFFLIDFIGRKRSLMSGITLQFISMMYMAIFLLVDTTVGDEGAEQTASQKAAAKGALGMIYVSGFGWALGWNSIQYLINSEIYPLRLRALGGSIAMSVSVPTSITFYIIKNLTNAVRSSTSSINTAIRRQSRPCSCP